jgi:hypothetical protein
VAVATTPAPPMWALGRKLKIRRSEKKTARYFRNNNIKMYLTTIWCGVLSGVKWLQIKS